MPSATQPLLIVTVAAFLLQIAMGDALVARFALWPLGQGFAPWQLVTYAFLHGGVAHLAFNMWGLWMFGNEIERVVGPMRLLTLYFASVVSASAAQLIVATASGNVYPTVGASGGVFGLLLAFAIFFPNRQLMLLFPPIPMRARVFVTLYALIELTLGVSGSATGIAHFAHLGGMVGGYLVIRHWRGQRLR